MSPGWDRISVGTDLPEVVDPIDYQRVVMNAAATWDYFEGHHDPEYARRHGHPTIFVNTMHIAGFIDRVISGESADADTAFEDAIADLEREINKGPEGREGPEGSEPS